MNNMKLEELVRNATDIVVDSCYPDEEFEEELGFKIRELLGAEPYTMYMRVFRWDDLERSDCIMEALDFSKQVDVKFYTSIDSVEYESTIMVILY